MTIARLEAVALRPAGRPLFSGIDWSIGKRARIGLVGANGAGKSRLLELLAKRIPPDDGRVVHERGLHVGWLAQEPDWPAGTSLIEAAGRLAAPLRALQRELAGCEARLSEPSVYEDESRLAAALRQQEALVARWRELGGDRHGSRVRSLLAHFGIDRSRYGTEARDLSGGQKKLVALVALAAAEPGLLLLDEPDNHLDLAAVEKLERFIADYPGAVVVVSHDRYLLDSCVERIAELGNGGLEHYVGGYSAYAAERELRRLRRHRRHAEQQKEVARIEAAIRRFELWASLVVNERHIRQARSRRKALERMQAGEDWVERPESRRRMVLDLEGGRGSRIALEMTDVGVGVGERILFEDVSLLVRHGERVGLCGPNGCGKSTLLRIARGEIEPWAGRVRTGPSTRIGWYAQEHEPLAEWHGRSPLDWVRDAAPMREDEAVRLLLRFLFRYEQLRSPIGALSGGERARLQLARLVLDRPNLLLLDEPTNHLDIPSAEVLESVLAEFEGAVVLVSHDRYFLDAVADRVIAFEDGALVEVEGGYTDYAQARGG